jgi:gamma-glutamyl-gamma-aminobutyraldehyde dehydrogenase
MSTHTLDDWIALASSTSPRGQAFINGDYVDSASGETFTALNPATGARLADVAACGEVDVDRAVSAARASFDSGAWSRTSPAERKRVLLRFAELVREHTDELALLVSQEMGKLVMDAVCVDVPFTAGCIQWYAEATDKVYGEVAATAPGDLAMVTREPLGVVAAIVPWNFPLNIAAWKIAPALAAGNSVVLKPAEQSSLSALVLGQLAVEAGMPPGVLNVATGTGASTGQAIGRHQGIDCLTFTGSTLVGKRLMSYAAESNLKQVWLECGGKSANMVFADSENLEAAADKACQGIFFNQGEVCSANSRLLVERGIKDEFLSLVIERAGRIRPGNPLDPASNLGAMAGKVHTDRVMAAIAAGRDDATLVLGGSRVSVGTSDCFVEPTVFNDVPNGARIAQDEVFGPVLAVIGFDTEDDAVRLANESPYGIAASVWTDNLSRAHRVAGRLHVGTVSVNTVDAMSNQTPFGGVKQSGFGRDLSLHALNQYTALKTTWISY